MLYGCLVVQESPFHVVLQKGQEPAPQSSSRRLKVLRAKQKGEAPAWAMRKTLDTLVASAAQFGGYATSTQFEDDAMVFAFGDELDALHFCHTAQMALLYDDWGAHPGRQVDVFGPVIHTADGRLVFAGPRVSMVLHRGGGYRCGRCNCV